MTTLAKTPHVHTGAHFPEHARAPSAPEAARPVVLFVDDEPKTLLIARDILGAAGYEVETARDGRDALDRFRPGAHAAVVTDIRMPHLSGIELVERIRERDEAVPILIMTGCASVETAMRAVAAGAFEYLLKPLDFDRLKTSLARGIERRRLADENRRLVASLAVANERLERLSASLEEEVRARTLDLHEQRDLQERVFAAIPSAIAVLGPEGSARESGERAGASSGPYARPPRDAATDATMAAPTSDVFDDAGATSGSSVRAFLRSFRERSRGDRRALLSRNAAFTRMGAAGRELLRAVEADITQVQAGGAPVMGRDLIVHDPESQTDWALRVSVIGLAGGRALVVSDDVTEAARMEDELVQVEKLLSLGTLAGGIVHDLASPITCVLGTADLLRPLVTAGEAVEHIDAIVSSGEYMRDVCHGLLDFARRARTGASISARAEEVVDRALSFARHSKKTAKVDVVRIVPGGLPPLAASPSELVQVIVNLVANACDAMTASAAGGGRLEISASEEGPLVRFRVKDSGPGIPESARASLFAPFFTTKGPGKGTGLGLFTSRRIMKRLGGRVEFETGPQGTTFTVDVPVAEGS